MCFFCVAGKTATQLWKRPPQGINEKFDIMNPPPPTRQGQPVGQSIHRANRGVMAQDYRPSQTYDVGQDTIMTPSLAREMTTSWQTGWWRTGGWYYPNDYGWGPGFHGDCMTPQFYMRPGLKRPVQQGGRQI